MWDFFLTPKGSELGNEFEIINETTIGKSQNHGCKSMYGNQIFKYEQDIDRLF